MRDRVHQLMCQGYSHQQATRQANEEEARALANKRAGWPEDKAKPKPARRRKAAAKTKTKKDD